MTKEGVQQITIAGFFISFSGAILFSTKAIIVKKAFADTGTSAISLLALRMIFSIPFYLLAAWFTSKKEDNTRFTKKQWLYVSVIGMMGYYISSLLDFLGLQYVSAGIERLILFLYPTFAVIINAKWFGNKVSLRQKLALLITYAGIALAYFGELSITKADDNFLWGSFLVFVCAITYSLYLVGSARLIPAVGASKFTAYAMLAATAGVLLHFVLFGEPLKIHFSNQLFFYSVLLGIIATVIPSFLMNYGMKLIGGNNAAIVTSIGPVSTILQAHYILGEPIFPAQLAGTALVIVGVLLIGWKKKLPLEK